MARDRFGDIEIASHQEDTENQESVSGEDVPADVQPLSSGTEDSAGTPADIPLEKRDELPAGHLNDISAGKSWLNVIVRGLAVLLVLVIFYGGAAYFLVPFLVQNILVPDVSKRIERPVTIKRVVFSPFTFRMVLSGISIGAKSSGQGSGDGLLQSEQMSCQLGLGEIFSGKLICSGIILEGVSIHLQRTSSDFSDLSDLFQLLGLRFTDMYESIWPSWLIGGELTFSGGTIVLHDAVNNREYLIEKLELYLPHAQGSSDINDRLPELSAVVNGSPVHVAAERLRNSDGKLETSFDMRVQDLFVVHYLEYLPWQSTQYTLDDGKGDLDLKIIFPAEGGDINRFIFSGDLSLKDIEVVDKQNHQAALIHGLRTGFTFRPGEKMLSIKNMVLTRPEVNLLLGAAGRDDRSGFPLEKMSDFVGSIIQSRNQIRIEQLEATDGKLNFSDSTSAQPVFSWDEVSFKLRNFENPAPNVEKALAGNSEPAYFALNAQDKSENKPMIFTAEGQIHPGRGSSGRFSVTHLNLNRYGGFLPTMGLQVNDGAGDIRFSYDFAAGPSQAGQDSGYSFLLSQGYAELVNSNLQIEYGEIKSISGGKIICDGLQADPSARKMICESLSLNGAIIATGEKIGTLTESKSKKWQFEIGHLKIEDSKLGSSFLKNICAAAPDISLSNLSLSADNLRDAVQGANIKASASVNDKGNIVVGGEYSTAQHSGRFNVNLHNIDFSLLGTCLETFVVPEVKKGFLDAQGVYAYPEKEFSGNVAVKDFEAGDENGPLISWQSGVARSVFFHFSPAILDLGNVQVSKPLILAGLLDSDVAMDNFIRPGKTFFKQFTAAEVRIEDGRFAMPWPIVLPGYQPQLSALTGTLQSLGSEESPFSLNGRVEGFSEFSMQGILNKRGIRSYSLDAGDMYFAPFATYFKHEFGLPADTLQGSLHQEYVRQEKEIVLKNRLYLSGVDPDPTSPFYTSFALMLSENGNLTIETQDSVPLNKEPLFLLTAVKRYLQHQEVRAGLDARLLLRETLPAVETPVQTDFVPGSAELSTPGELDGYKQLLARRPLLGLRLQGFYDAEADRKAMQAELQNEADRKRDEENQRRAREKKKQLAKQEQRLVDANKRKTSIEAEEIPPEELEVEPLPYLKVNVSDAMLVDLARTRTRTVAHYLQDSLQIDPERIRIDETVKTGSSQVQFFFFPIKNGMDRGSQNED